MSLKTHLCALVAGAAAAALAGAAQARPADFSIAQVLSAPFPSSLVANGADGRVAWVSNDKGMRNVWVTDASGAARAITHYQADDGSDLGELAWDASAGLVLYSHGGSLEGGGPVNIMSLPGGPPPQQVWAASVAGGEPRLIGPGHTPEVSPDGSQVAYLLGGQVWAAPLKGEGKPAQLIADRGQTREIAWSPDGSRLAFVSTRGDHSVIGVYDLSAKAITWLQPSVDTDSSPVWSPDGSRLAFIRLPAGAGGFFAGDWHEAQPWTLWVADARSGQARMVWTADRGAGSKFQEWAGGPPLIWAKGDRLLFPWEKSGWLHLWSVSAAGGQAQDLTPGQFEIFVVSPSPDGARITYSSNQDDIDHRHLWEVSASGGAPRRLTSGASIEDYPVVAGDGRLFALHGDARRPMEAVSLAASGRMGELAPQMVPADFPASKLVEPQQVVFTSPDGVQVHGQLFLPPKGVAAKPGPAMLFFHGGPIRQMLLGWHPMDAYAFMYGFNQYLASEGYAVLSVNYRGGTGYGLEFREPKDFGWMGSSELKDIEGAIAYLHTRADVDPKRIGVWGGSYGGLMTALALSRHSDQLAAGVDYAGVHDWSKFLSQIPGIDAATLKRAFDASAMSTVDKWRSPVLIVHADDDRNVPFSQSVQLAEGLRKNHVEFEQMVITNEIHDLLRHQSWIDFLTASDDFLGRKVMNAPKP